MMTPARPIRERWINYINRQARNYLLAIFIAAVVILVARESWASYSHWRLTQAEATEWIEYHSITYVGEDPEGRAGLGSLRMQSDRSVYRDVRLRFLDTLRCRPQPFAGDSYPGLDYEFVTQNQPTELFSAQIPGRRETVNWLYNADYPRGRECVVRSIIEATVNDVSKFQTVQSPPFVVKTGP